jgi:hydrogenase maturation protease
MRLLLGVGNPDRGDDGVGTEVAARVARLGIPGVEVATEAEPLALLEHLRRTGLDQVVVVDATVPGPEPGRVRVLPVGAARLVRRTGPAGTHALGVADAVELARALDLLPARLALVGVEAGSSGVGEGLSGPVQARLGDVVRTVTELLGASDRLADHGGVDREHLGQTGEPEDLQELGVGAADLHGALVPAHEPVGDDQRVQAGRVQGRHVVEAHQQVALAGDEVPADRPGERGPGPGVEGAVQVEDDRGR